MLATTQPEDIPQTIRSRCQHFSFRAVKFKQIVEQLRDLCGRESISADEDALDGEQPEQRRRPGRHPHQDDGKQDAEDDDDEPALPPMSGTRR